jgi:plastocyanin
LSKNNQGDRLIMRVETIFSVHGLKSTVVLSCVIATVVLATAVAKTRAAKPAIVIKMLDMPASFEPPRTTIKVGDTVEWRNIGTQLHHVTTDPSAALKKNDISIPPGAKPFDSGFLKPGESFSETFSVPGTYRYTCAVHEAKGMNGELIVQK